MTVVLMLSQCWAQAVALSSFEYVTKFPLLGQFSDLWQLSNSSSVAPLCRAESPVPLVSRMGMLFIHQSLVLAAGTLNTH